jgi:hypothetical protein
MLHTVFRLIRIGLIPVFLLQFAPGATAGSLTDKLYDDYGIEFSGFAEVRQGWRLQEDPFQKETSISEARLQLAASKDFDVLMINVKGDLLGDAVENQVTGDLRELNLVFSPFDFMDVKMGRQTLTWGTGDLLFINDLFPKDWKSFFIGRDDEYLKAPTDALKIGLFSKIANLDFIYVPVFNNSVYIDGKRLSYYNGVLGRTAGNDFVFFDDKPNQIFNDAEYALRLSKNIAGFELALYGYYGFWKTPEGLDAAALRLIYPRLAVYGASLRAPMLGGIAHIEGGYYDSLDDRNGNIATVRNSEIRFLAGYERELAANFTAGIQYYLEVMSDHDTYAAAAGTTARDQYRHLITLRLTKLMLNQTLRLGLFVYYSPNDADGYLRPKIHYKLTDAWALEVGANIFFGADRHTFFGQFDKNTNAHAGIRFSF